MLNVGIDLERLRNLNSGLGQFCWYLSTHLNLIQPTNLNLEFYYPKGFNGKLIKSHSVTILDKLLGIKNKNLQLLHCTHQDSKLFSSTIPNIVTIHDLNFLEKYNNPLKQKKILQHLQAKINKAKGIVFISNYTKALVIKHLTLPNIPTRVIYNGNCLNMKIESRKPNGANSSSFLFTIGIINPKKNFHTLLPLVQKTGKTLIIAGNKTHPYAQHILQLANELDVSNKVILLGNVTEHEKLWLYQHCEAFVFPSLAEGFGLPVIEAMSMGKPVFLSNKTSLPEVGGDLAYYWNDFEPNNMTAVFNANINNNNIKHSAESIVWAEQFNWDKTAREYIDFYIEVYKTL